MSSVPWIHSAAAVGRRTAISSGIGRVSVRDPDGGRHVMEVVGHANPVAGPAAYQIRVDSWYHVAWASSADEVQNALDRVRRAITDGWLPGDADLPDLPD
jgi:hypothetical protein